MITKHRFMKWTALFFMTAVMIFSACEKEALDAPVNHELNSVTRTNTSPTGIMPEGSLVPVNSLEELTQVLKKDGLEENEINNFIEMEKLEELFNVDEISFRGSNCSCSDDASFYVRRYGSYFVIQTIVTPYDPALFLESDEYYDCDSNSIFRSHRRKFSYSLQGCSQSAQTFYFNARYGLKEGKYDLYFSLERVGPYSRDCDWAVFRGFQNLCDGPIGF